MVQNGSSLVNRLKSTASTGLPFWLLLLALSAVFLFGGDRGHFYRSGHHGWVSSEQLAIASNLSPGNRFLMYFYKPYKHDASSLYNRWPVTSYALISMVILPFGDDLSAQIYAARMLILVFFAGAAVTACLSLSRLVSDPWAALAATLLTFSSYYCLYYNDMVSPEIIISLFGVLLTFHGMVVFMQEGHFRQLLIKACIALLLGWYVYALLLPFIIFGLASEFIRSAQPLPPRAPTNVKRLAALLIRSRFLALGVATFLVGLVLLAFNFTNEYLALKGEVPLTDLPTFNSLQARIGASPEFNVKYAEKLGWGSFLEEQFYRLGGLTLPFWLSNYYGDLDKYPAYPAGLAGALVIVIGIAVSVACLVWAVFSRSRILLTAFLLSGFIWALVFRHQVVFHDYLILYFIGVPLICFSMVALCLRKLFGNGLVLGLAIAAALGFVLSSFQMSRIGRDSQGAGFHEALIADFENVRKATAPAARIFVPVPDSPRYLVAFAGARHAVNFYLTGRLIGYKTPKSDADSYDFVLTPIPLESDLGLTPENQLRFLYRSREYSASFNKMVELIGATEPVRRSNFNVYLEDGRLIYLKAPCGLDDINARFLLRLTPGDVNDLPRHSRERGFAKLDFSFYGHGAWFDGKCLAQVSLPGYDVVEINTGQYVYEQGVYVEVWREKLRLE